MPTKPMLSEPSIKITKRTDRSILTFNLHHLLKPFNHRLIALKKTWPPGSPRLDFYHGAEKYCDVVEREVEGMYIYDLVLKQKTQTAPENQELKRRRLYYVAGGSWQQEPSKEHWKWCTELARQLPEIIVSVISCPLAPKSPAPSAFPQLMSMYKKLLLDAEEAHEEIILGGDSSGGNIVLCLAMAHLAEDDNGPCPAAIMAICASCNPRNDNPKAREVEKHDPILRIDFSINNANKWRGEWDASDPRVCPLMADVSLLARKGIRVHGVTAGYDILSPDSVLFREKCAEAGVNGEWLEWDKQMHCFTLAWMYKLPESVEAKNWVLNVFRRC